MKEIAGPIGNKYALKKSLGIFDLFTIGFGAIIGVGWAISIGEWFQKGGGPFATAFAFVAAAAFLIPVAKAYGELTAAIPNAGGAMVYVYKGCGEPLAFITGWLLVLAYVMMCPWEIIAIAQLLEVLFPALQSFPLYTIQGSVVYTPSLVLSLMVGGVVILANLKGVDMAVKLQKTLVLGILITVSVGVAVSLFLGDLNNLLPLTARTAMNPDGGFLNGFLAVLAITPFFFSGFDTIAQGSEECEEGIDKQQVGRIMVTSIVISALFYLVIIFTAGISAPWQQLAGLSLPAIQLYREYFSLSWVTWLIAFAAFCGLATTLNSFFVSSARLLLAMGRAELLPSALARINHKTHAPANANLAVGIIVIAGAFLGKGMLLPIINVCSVGFLFAWLMVAVAALKLRKTHPDLERPYHTHKFTIQAGIVVSLALLAVLLVPGSPGALVWPVEHLIVAVWLVAGIIQYSLRKSRSSPASDPSHI